MTRIYRSLMVVTLGAFLAGSAVACSHAFYRDARGYAQIEVVDGDGYQHRGYYDRDNYWHGGYYDHDHRFHNDARDWRRR